MKLSLCIQTPDVQPIVSVALLSGTLEEKLDKAAKWGADGLELMTINPKELDVAALRQSLKKCGLEVSAIASGAMAFATGLTLLHSDPQKAELAKALTEACVRVIGSKPEGVDVIFVDVKKENWASGGVLWSDKA